MTATISINFGIEKLYASESPRLRIPVGIGGRPIPKTTFSKSFTTALASSPAKHLIVIGDAASIRRAAKYASGSGRTRIARGAIKVPRSHALIGRGILGTVTNTQFFRESCYAINRGQQKPTMVTCDDGTRTTVKTGRHKSSAAEVICEAARVGLEFSKNLDMIMEPITHYGLDHTELLNWYNELKAQAESIMVPCARNGTPYQRHQSPTTVILLGAVASYPGPPDDADERYVAWKKLTVEWAKKHYGENLVSIIEHIDEPSGHLHILAARKGHGVKCLTAEDAGIKEAEVQGLAGKEFGVVVNVARSRLQDEFHAAVSSPLGIARLCASPKPRKAYNQAKAEQLRTIGLKLEVERSDLELNKRAHAVQKRKDRIDTDEAERQNMLVMIANKTLAQDLECERRKLKNIKADAMTEIETMRTKLLADAAAEIQAIKNTAKVGDSEFREVVEYSRRMQIAYKNLLDNFVPLERLEEARVLTPKTGFSSNYVTGNWMV